MATEMTIALKNDRARSNQTPSNERNKQLSSREATETRSPSDIADEPRCPADRVIKWTILSIMVCFIIYLICDYTIPELGFVNDILMSFLRWVADHPIEGVFAFAAVYAVATILFIPGSILTLGAGFIFGRALGLALGIVLGSTSVFIGATTGAIASFLLGRYVLQEWAQKFTQKYTVMKAVDKAIETKGLTVLILFRLSPVIPFSVFNYIVGLTRVSLKDYSIACLGILPGTVGYVFIGTSASGFLGGDDDSGGGDEEGAQTAQLLIFIIGGVFTIIAVVALSWYAKRILKQILDEAEVEERSTEEAGDIEDAKVVRVDNDPIVD
mmetsp:Transcript_21637/g.43440  ORF Transcript_21637/g.43440 Transcript_21637/m.43440 type:complete len:326 (-) Transcript_21637:237-1214(-)|eukprot:CAMPEP_0167817008 /NCGR_PEP_ID=MMETSP0112_2-20121227/3940_1 /TAXON_ID=91324 /ORGANISM="Lotharella globosa, Strain CCCM811" /LENGTH=325 /DNA_ID=CAMNT_0007716693 /DNA_START=87 /DNA_END=1064 /DNA_ORIENTATION=+